MKKTRRTARGGSGLRARFHAALARAVCAAAVAMLSVCCAAAQSLAVLRSSQAALPESIQREAYAAIDRARPALANLLGGAGAGARLFPLLALCDPSPGAYTAFASAAAERALARAQERISRPWKPDFAADAAAAALALGIMRGGALPPALAARLARTDLRRMAPADAAILLLALESGGAPQRSKWRALAEITNPAAMDSPSPAAVALSALCHLMAAPRGGMAPPPPAALSRLRWCAARTALCGRRSSEEPSPEAALFIALAASRLPRAAFTGAEPPLPFDWRARLAAHLVARQVFDSGSGAYVWKPCARANACAILALLAVSD